MSKMMNLLGAGVVMLAMAACSNGGSTPTTKKKGAGGGPPGAPGVAGPGGMGWGGGMGWRGGMLGPGGKAQAAPGKRWRRGPRGLLRKLDADGDRKLSRAELVGAAKALLAFDGNGDGELSFEEVHPAGRRWGRRGPRGGGKGMGANRPWRRPRGLWGKLDADGDGKLSKAEVAGAAKALLALDGDGDGELSFDELRPHRRWRGRGWHRGRGRGWHRGRGGMWGGRGRGGMWGGRGRGGMWGGPPPADPPAGMGSAR